MAKKNNNEMIDIKQLDKMVEDGVDLVNKKILQRINLNNKKIQDLPASFIGSESIGFSLDELDNAIRERMDIIKQAETLTKTNKKELDDLRVLQYDLGEVKKLHDEAQKNLSNASLKKNLKELEQERSKVSRGTVYSEGTGGELSSNKKREIITTSYLPETQTVKKKVKEEEKQQKTVVKEDAIVKKMQEVVGNNGGNIKAEIDERRKKKNESSFIKNVSPLVKNLSKGKFNEKILSEIESYYKENGIVLKSNDQDKFQKKISEILQNKKLTQNLKEQAITNLIEDPVKINEIRNKSVQKVISKNGVGLERGTYSSFITENNDVLPAGETVKIHHPDLEKIPKINVLGQYEVGSNINGMTLAKLGEQYDYISGRIASLKKNNINTNILSQYNDLKKQYADGGYKDNDIWSQMQELKQKLYPDEIREQIKSLDHQKKTMLKALKEASSYASKNKDGYDIFERFQHQIYRQTNEENNQIRGLSFDDDQIFSNQGQLWKDIRKKGVVERDSYWYEKIDETETTKNTNNKDRKVQIKEDRKNDLEYRENNMSGNAVSIEEAKQQDANELQVRQDNPVKKSDINEFIGTSHNLARLYTYKKSIDTIAEKYANSSGKTTEDVLEQMFSLNPDMKSLYKDSSKFRQLFENNGGFSTKTGVTFNAISSALWDMNKSEDVSDYVHKLASYFKTMEIGHGVGTRENMTQAFIDQATTNDFRQKYYEEHEPDPIASEIKIRDKNGNEYDGNKNADLPVSLYSKPASEDYINLSAKERWINSWQGGELLAPYGVMSSITGSGENLDTEPIDQAIANATERLSMIKKEIDIVKNGNYDTEESLFKADAQLMQLEQEKNKIFTDINSMRLWKDDILSEKEGRKPTKEFKYDPETVKSSFGIPYIDENGNTAYANSSEEYRKELKRVAKAKRDSQQNHDNNDIKLTNNEVNKKKYKLNTNRNNFNYKKDNETNREYMLPYSEKGKQELASRAESRAMEIMNGYKGSSIIDLREYSKQYSRELNSLNLLNWMNKGYIKNEDLKIFEDMMVRSLQYYGDDNDRMNQEIQYRETQWREDRVTAENNVNKFQENLEGQYNDYISPMIEKRKHKGVENNEEKNKYKLRNNNNLHYKEGLYESKPVEPTSSPKIKNEIVETPLSTSLDSEQKTLADFGPSVQSHVAEIGKAIQIEKDKIATSEQLVAQLGIEKKALEETLGLASGVKGTTPASTFGYIPQLRVATENTGGKVSFEEQSDIVEGKNELKGEQAYNLYGKDLFDQATDALIMAGKTTDIFTENVRMESIGSNAWLDSKEHKYHYIDKNGREQVLEGEVSASQFYNAGKIGKKEWVDTEQVKAMKTLVSEMLTIGSVVVKHKDKNGKPISSTATTLDELSDFTGKDFGNIGYNEAQTIIGNTVHKMLELTTKYNVKSVDELTGDAQKEWTSFFENNNKKYEQIYGTRAVGDKSLINVASGKAEVINSLYNTVAEKTGIDLTSVQKLTETAMVGQYVDDTTGARQVASGTFDIMLGNILGDIKTTGGIKDSVAAQFRMLSDLIWVNSDEIASKMGIANDASSINSFINSLKSIVFQVGKDGSGIAGQIPSMSNQQVAELLTGVKYNQMMSEKYPSLSISEVLAQVYSYVKPLEFSEENQKLYKEFEALRRDRATRGEFEQLAKKLGFATKKVGQKGNDETYEWEKIDETTGKLLHISGTFNKNGGMLPHGDSLSYRETDASEANTAKGQYLKLLRQELDLEQKIATLRVQKNAATLKGKTQEAIDIQSQIENLQQLLQMIRVQKDNTRFSDDDEQSKKIKQDVEDNYRSSSEGKSKVFQGETDRSKIAREATNTVEENYRDLLRAQKKAELELASLLEKKKDGKTDITGKEEEFLREKVKEAKKNRRQFAGKYSKEHDLKSISEDFGKNEGSKMEQEFMIAKNRKIVDKINPLLSERKNIFKEIGEKLDIGEDISSPIIQKLRQKLATIDDMIDKEISDLNLSKKERTKVSNYVDKQKEKSEREAKEELNEKKEQEKFSAQKEADKKDLLDQEKRKQQLLAEKNKLIDSQKKVLPLSDSYQKIQNEIESLNFQISENENLKYDANTRQISERDKDGNWKVKATLTEAEAIKFQQTYNHELFKTQQLQDSINKSVQKKGFMASIKESIDSTLQYMLVWQAGEMIISKVRQAIQTVVNTTKELDKIMTNLQIVTGKTKEETYEMMKNYSSLAKELGGTIGEISSSANEWLRMGYTAEEVNTLITDTMMLSKLGMIDTTKATEYLTSAIKGYGVAVKDASEIVDMATALDMKYAVSSGYILEAMARTAASAKLAKVEMSDLQAMIAVAGEVTQKDASVIGESFKTAFARYGNVKASAFIGNSDVSKLEDVYAYESNLSENSDSMAKVNDIEKVLNEVNIDVREKDMVTWRSYTDILNEVGEAWKTYSDYEKNAITTALFGTRQRENGLVTLQNYSRVLDAQKIAISSVGTAAKKYEAYENGLEAATKRVSAAMEEMILNMQMNGVLKDLSNSIVWLIKNLKALAIIGGGIFALWNIDSVILKLNKISFLINNKLLALKNKDIRGLFSGTFEKVSTGVNSSRNYFETEQLKTLENKKQLTTAELMTIEFQKMLDICRGMSYEEAEQLANERKKSLESEQQRNNAVVETMESEKAATAEKVETTENVRQTEAETAQTIEDMIQYDTETSSTVQDVAQAEAEVVSTQNDRVQAFLEEKSTTQEFFQLKGEKGQTVEDFLQLKNEELSTLQDKLQLSDEQMQTFLKSQFGKNQTIGNLLLNSQNKLTPLNSMLKTSGYLMGAMGGWNFVSQLGADEIENPIVKYATKIGGAVGGVGLSIVGGAIGGPLGAAIGGAVAFGIGKAVEWAKENAEEALQQTKDELAKLEEEYSKASSLETSTNIDRYDELAQGVNNLGENISLTKDEYEEFLNIGNELAETFPELVNGTDRFGNSLLGVNGQIGGLREQITGLLKNLQEEVDMKLLNPDLAEEQFANTKKRIRQINEDIYDKRVTTDAEKWLDKDDEEQELSDDMLEKQKTQEVNSFTSQYLPAIMRKSWNYSILDQNLQEFSNRMAQGLDISKFDNFEDYKTFIEKNIVEPLNTSSSELIPILENLYKFDFDSGFSSAQADFENFNNYLNDIVKFYTKRDNKDLYDKIKENLGIVTNEDGSMTNSYGVTVTDYDILSDFLGIDNTAASVITKIQEKLKDNTDLADKISSKFSTEKLKEITEMSSDKIKNIAGTNPDKQLENIEKYLTDNNITSIQTLVSRLTKAIDNDTSEGAKQLEDYLKNNAWNIDPDNFNIDNFKGLDQTTKDALTELIQRAKTLGVTVGEAYNNVKELLSLNKYGETSLSVSNLASRYEELNEIAKEMRENGSLTFESYDKLESFPELQELIGNPDEFLEKVKHIMANKSDLIEGSIQEDLAQNSSYFEKLAEQYELDFEIYKNYAQLRKDIEKYGDLYNKETNTLNKKDLETRLKNEMSENGYEYTNETFYQDVLDYKGIKYDSAEDAKNVYDQWVLAFAKGIPLNFIISEDIETKAEEIAKRTAEIKINEVNKSYRDFKKSQRDYNKSIRDLNKQARDQEKKEYLQEITDMLERRNLVIQEYDNKIKVNEAAQSFLDPSDFGGKNIALSDKYDLASKKLSELKDEFEYLNTITPQSSEQAEKLASQYETLATSIMETEQSLFTMEQEMQSMGLEVFSKNLENINNQYERETSLLNNMSSLLKNDNGIVDAWDLVNLNAYGSVKRDEITDNRSKYDTMIKSQEEYQKKSLEMRKKYLDLLKEENEEENTNFWTDHADSLTDAQESWYQTQIDFWNSYGTYLEEQGFGKEDLGITAEAFKWQESEAIIEKSAENIKKIAKDFYNDIPTISVIEDADIPTKEKDKKTEFKVNPLGPEDKWVPTKEEDKKTEFKVNPLGPEDKWVPTKEETEKKNVYKTQKQLVKEFIQYFDPYYIDGKSYRIDPNDVLDKIFEKEAMDSQESKKQSKKFEYPIPELAPQYTLPVTQEGSLANDIVTKSEDAGKVAMEQVETDGKTKSELQLTSPELKTGEWMGSGKKGDKQSLLGRIFNKILDIYDDINTNKSGNFQLNAPILAEASWDTMKEQISDYVAEGLKDGLEKGFGDTDNKPSYTGTLAPSVKEGYADVNLPMRRKEELTADDLDKIIEYQVKKEGKTGSLLLGQGKAFKEAEKITGISAVDILSHAALESDWGTSQIARDKFNFFGYGAVDNNPYDGAWDFTDAGISQNEAIGNAIVSTYSTIADYYHDEGQDTLYKMRWNNGVHQYATDKDWDQKIANIRAMVYSFADLLSLMDKKTENPTEFWKNPSFYANGTTQNGHNGGPAVVGEGKYDEIVAMPNKAPFIITDPTLFANLPKGTHVIPITEYANGTDSAKTIVEEAKEWLGSPYRWGGNSKTGVDCSGLVQEVMKTLGIDMSRTTYTQVKEGKEVNETDLEQWQEGDLVFFGSKTAPTHVGIYIGNGEYIHAPKSGDVVKTSKISDRNDIGAVRRMIDDISTGTDKETIKEGVTDALSSSGTTKLIDAVINHYGDDLGRSVLRASGVEVEDKKETPKIKAINPNVFENDIMAIIQSEGRELSTLIDEDKKWIEKAKEKIFAQEGKTNEEKQVEWEAWQKQYEDWTNNLDNPYFSTYWAERYTKDVDAINERFYYKLADLQQNVAPALKENREKNHDGITEKRIKAEENAYIKTLEAERAADQVKLLDEQKSEIEKYILHLRKIGASSELIEKANQEYDRVMSELTEANADITEAQQAVYDAFKEAAEFSKQQADYKNDFLLDQYNLGNTTNKAYSKRIDNIEKSLTDMRYERARWEKAWINDYLKENEGSTVRDAWEAMQSNEQHIQMMQSENDALTQVKDVMKEELDDFISDLDRTLKKHEMSKPEKWDNKSQISKYYQVTENFYDTEIARLKQYLATAENLSLDEYEQIVDEINQLEKDKLANSIATYTDLISYQESIYSALQYRVNEYIDDLNLEKEAVSDRYDEEIEKLTKVNEDKERSIKLTELQQKLENAQTQKKRVYRQGIGFVYESDRAEVKTATQELESFWRQDRIDDLNTAKDIEMKFYDERIEGWNKYLEGIEKQTKRFEAAQNHELLMRELGVDTLEELDSKLINDRDSFLIEYDYQNTAYGQYNTKYTGLFDKFLADYENYLWKLDALQETMFQSMEEKFNVTHDKNIQNYSSHTSASVKEWQTFQEQFGINDIQALLNDEEALSKVVGQISKYTGERITRDYIGALQTAKSTYLNQTAELNSSQQLLDIISGKKSNGITKILSREDLLTALNFALEKEGKSGDEINKTLALFDPSVIKNSISTIAQKSLEDAKNNIEVKTIQNDMLNSIKNSEYYDLLNSVTQGQICELIANLPKEDDIERAIQELGNYLSRLVNQSMGNASNSVSLSNGKTEHVGTGTVGSNLPHIEGTYTTQTYAKGDAFAPAIEHSNKSFRKSNIETMKAFAKAKGTDSDGTDTRSFLAGEEGLEIGVYPDGTVVAYGANGPEIYENEPLGTTIFTAEESAKILGMYKNGTINKGINKFTGMSLFNSLDYSKYLSNGASTYMPEYFNPIPKYENTNSQKGDTIYEIHTVELPNVEDASTFWEELNNGVQRHKKDR